MREVISNRIATISMRDLTLVEAVAYYRGFRSAAEIMGISASGLSYQVRKVEEAIGFDIFERGRKVSLTEDGQYVIDIIRKTISIMAGIDKRRAVNGRVLGPLLRIGTISSLAPSDLLRIMKHCQQHSPETQVEIISGKHNGLFRRLVEREIDVLISADPAIPVGYEAIKLFEEGFICIKLNDGDDTFFSSSSDDFPPPSCMDEKAGRHNQYLRSTNGVGIEQRIALVSAGYGSTIAPENWLKRADLSNDLVLEPVKGKRKMRAIWRQSFALCKELTLLWMEFSDV